MNNFSSFNGESETDGNFQKIAGNIGTNIQKISQTVSSMRRMVDLLGTPQDSSDIRHQLQNLQQYTHQLVKDTNISLKTLSNIPPPSSEYEQRKWKIQKERLTEEFTTTLNLFQSTQRKALKKESEQIKITRSAANPRPCGIAPPPSSDPFRDDIHPNQLIQLQDTQDEANLQVQLETERNNLRQLQEQEEAIRTLERDISDVNQIYKDLGKLVHEQGEAIDSIEANIENTHVTIRDATSELRKASNYMSKRRKKCFIIWVVLLIILLVIGFIIYQG